MRVNGTEQSEVNGMSRLNGENLTILNQRKIFALDMRVNGAERSERNVKA